MSSYLSVYLHDKKSGENKYLTCYSRNSSIYQALSENIDIAFCGEDDEKFTTVNYGDIDGVIDNLKEDREKAQRRLTETERYAKDNADLIDDIISYKEYIADINSSIDQLSVFSHIIYDICEGGGDFDAVLMNIS